MNQVSVWGNWKRPTQQLYCRCCWKMTSSEIVARTKLSRMDFSKPNERFEIGTLGLNVSLEKILCSDRWIAYTPGLTTYLRANASLRRMASKAEHDHKMSSALRHKMSWLQTEEHVTVFPVFRCITARRKSKVLANALLHAFAVKTDAASDKALLSGVSRLSFMAYHIVS